LTPAEFLSDFMSGPDERRPTFLHEFVARLNRVPDVPETGPLELDFHMKELWADYAVGVWIHDDVIRKVRSCGLVDDVCAVFHPLRNRRYWTKSALLSYHSALWVMGFESTSSDFIVEAVRNNEPQWLNELLTHSDYVHCSSDTTKSTHNIWMEALFRLDSHPDLWPNADTNIQCYWVLLLVITRDWTERHSFTNAQRDELGGFLEGMIAWRFPPRREHSQKLTDRLRSMMFNFHAPAIFSMNSPVVPSRGAFYTRAQLNDPMPWAEWSETKVIMVRRVLDDEHAVFSDPDALAYYMDMWYKWANAQRPGSSPLYKRLPYASVAQIMSD